MTVLEYPPESLEAVAVDDDCLPAPGWLRVMEASLAGMVWRSLDRRHRTLERVASAKSRKDPRKIIQNP